MIFFSATDVGGARAIIPVFHELEKLSIPFCMMDDGILSTESDPSYHRIAPPTIETKEPFCNFAISEGIRLVCIGTAVEKRLPIYHALWAAELGIPSVAVLDNWMNYQQRFALPEVGISFPDHYFVMDEYAHIEAMRDGVPPSILEVTGHPGLASLAFEAENHGQRVKGNDSAKRLLFISEPAAQDQGAHVGVSTYRGYTEFDVLRIAADFMALQGMEYELVIAPHPREDKDALQSFCTGSFPPSIKWTLSSHARSRDALFEADGVIGMTSILLYEAWLLGLPVISLQPDLRGMGASHFLNREGCSCVTETGKAQSALNEWMISVVSSERNGTRFSSDLIMHRSAPWVVAKRLMELAEGNSSSPDGTNAMDGAS